MNENEARSAVVTELGAIATRLEWDLTHPQVTAILRDAEDLLGETLGGADDRLARAALRYAAWRRAWQALAVERAVSLPLGGGSVGNDALYEHAKEQAAAAWHEYWSLTGGKIIVDEVFA